MITKQNAAQWLPLVRAMAEGKTIQVRYVSAPAAVIQWDDTDRLSPGAGRFPDDYRIKPTPRLRAWKEGEIPAGVFLVRTIGSVPTYFPVRHNPNDHRFPIAGVDDSRGRDWSLESARDCLLYLRDGTEHPCGVLCEGEEHGEG